MLPKISYYLQASQAASILLKLQKTPHNMKSHTLQGITKAPSTYKKADVKIKKESPANRLLRKTPVPSPFYTPPLVPTHSTAQIPNTLTLPAPTLPVTQDSPRCLHPAYPIFIMPANSMRPDTPLDSQALKEHIFNNQARIQKLGALL